MMTPTSNIYTVISGTPSSSDIDKLFDSGVTAAGPAFQYTFDTAGESTLLLLQTASMDGWLQLYL